jgi:hypothetical protein
MLETILLWLLLNAAGIQAVTYPTTTVSATLGPGTVSVFYPDATHFQMCLSYSSGGLGYIAVAIAGNKIVSRFILEVLLVLMLLWDISILLELPTSLMDTRLRKVSRKILCRILK